MARFINAQRRTLLVFATVFFTILIRLVSLSAGHSLRASRSGFVISDRGPFKQVAFRIRPSKRSAPYLLRIANFTPFVMLENLGFSAEMNALRPHVDSEFTDSTTACGCNCNCNCNCNCYTWKDGDGSSC